METAEEHHNCDTQQGNQFSNDNEGSMERTNLFKV